MKLWFERLSNGNARMYTSEPRPDKHGWRSSRGSHVYLSWAIADLLSKLTEVGQVAEFELNCVWEKCDD